jgi:succinoglycan biosynthesis protein ExoA
MSAAGQTPDVSVLVPVFNEERYIRTTVEAMRAQRFDGDIEFLFADGGSNDGTRAILDELSREDARIRMLDNPGRLAPRGLNVALDHARGEFVVRMDAHSWYPPDYIARGVERLRQGGVDWVSGPPIPRGRGKWGRRIALALLSPLGSGGSKKWRGDHGAGDADTREFELDSGVFAGVWRRELLQRYGGWHEGVAVAEDAEMAARFLADGRKLVCLPQMGAYYAPRESLAGLARQYARFGYFRTKTTGLHPHALRRSHLASMGLAILPLLAVTPSRWVSRPARAGLALYGLLVGGEGIRAGRGSSTSDALTLPVVFATMHLSWGWGGLASFVRHGPPWAAIRCVLLSRRPPGGGSAGSA